MNAYKSLLLKNRESLRADLTYMFIRKMPFTDLEAIAAIMIDESLGADRSMSYYRAYFGWSRQETEDFFEGVRWKL